MRTSSWRWCSCWSWPARPTVNLIGNGVLALLQFPEQRERLVADWRLEATVLEELLRFHSPIEVSTEPYAREPIEIAGVRSPRERRSMA